MRLFSLQIVAPLAVLYHPVGILWRCSQSSMDVGASSEMRFDTLVASPLPAQTRRARYINEKIGESQRILPNAFQQRFEMSSSGALITATENATKPTSMIVTNAGIAVGERFDLRTLAVGRCSREPSIWFPIPEPVLLKNS
jgi:hypothetical protein